MFWVRKLATAGMIAAVLVGVGLGLGVSVRQTPHAAAADPVTSVTGVAIRTPVEKIALPREPKAPTVRRLVLQVAGEGATGVYSATEFRGGEPVWFVTFRLSKPGDVTPVRAFLARALRDKDGPTEVSIYATTAARLDDVYAAAQACHEAGVKELRFTGYLPIGKYRVEPVPGPNGEAIGYKRIVDAPRTAEGLMQEVMSIWLRC